MVERFGVARPTVRQALAELRERGLIRTLHGRGSVVIKAPD
jgi:DNA-binding GntR family transcriptional regulator